MEFNTLALYRSAHSGDNIVRINKPPDLRIVIAAGYILVPRLECVLLCASKHQEFPETFLRAWDCPNVFAFCPQRRGLQEREAKKS